MPILRTEPQLETPAGSAPARPGLILAVVLSCQLMLGLDSTVVTIALPKIRELHFSTAGLAWVQNAYLLAFGGLLLLGGRAGDLLGRRRVFVVGVAGFVLASLVGGLATSAALLVTARAVQGVCAAIAGPSVLALIATNFHGHARAKAMSLYSAVTGAGGSVGLLVGGVLTGQVSWRWVFFINVPIGLAVVLIAPRVLKETERHPGRLDAAGAVLATGGMTALVWGLIRAASDGWHDTAALASLGASVVLLGGFLVVEAKVVRPVLPLVLFATKSRAGAYTAQLLLAATMFGYFFFLTQFLQDVLGFGPLEAGFAFLPTMLAQFGFVRAMPRLIQRFGMRPPMLTGIVAIAAGLAWLSQISAGTGYFPGVFGPLLLMGIGGGLCFMPLNLTILANVPAQISGAASGLAQTMVWAGGALGSAVFVSVAGTASRNAAAHHPGASAHYLLAHGMASAFTVAAALPVAALAVVLLTLPAAGRAGRSTAER